MLPKTFITVLYANTENLKPETSFHRMSMYPNTTRYGHRDPAVHPSDPYVRIERSVHVDRSDRVDRTDRVDQKTTCSWRPVRSCQTGCLFISTGLSMWTGLVIMLTGLSPVDPLIIRANQTGPLQTRQATRWYKKATTTNKTQQNHTIYNIRHNRALYYASCASHW